MSSFEHVSRKIEEIKKTVSLITIMERHGILLMD
jgi:hypothetical protein